MLKTDKTSNNQLQFHSFLDTRVYHTLASLPCKNEFSEHFTRNTVYTFERASPFDQREEFEGRISVRRGFRWARDTARFIPWLDGGAWEPLRKAFEVIEARCSDDISQPVRCLSHLDSSQSASSKYERYDPESRVKTDFGNTCCAVKCIGDRTREHAPVCIQGVSL